jgi:hypothetical protein
MCYRHDGRNEADFLIVVDGRQGKTRRTTKKHTKLDKGCLDKEG